MQYPMDKVFALYHADRTMPISVYATEELAFEAVEFYAAALLAKGNKRGSVLAEARRLREARREFSVVCLNVKNSLSLSNLAILPKLQLRLEQFVNT
jgi:hypothetical protein